jgi:hypothetical protein
VGKADDGGESLGRPREAEESLTSSKFSQNIFNMIIGNKYHGSENRNNVEP